MSQRNSNTAEALYRFFSSFRIPAYAIGSVPSEARPPYITYQVTVPERLKTVPFYAELWYRSSGLVDIHAKADEIETAIGEGVSIATKAGAVRVYANTSFLQDREFPGDPTLKCAYLSMMIAADTF